MAGAGAHAEEDRAQKANQWFWLGLTVGGALTGLALFLVLRERRLMAQLMGNGFGAAQLPSGHQGQPINIYNIQSPAQPFQLPEVIQATTTPAALLPSGGMSTEVPDARQSDLSSYSLSSTTPRRLFTATRRQAWRLQVRVAAPAGAFAYFSMDYSALRALAADGAMPVNGVSIVPVGDTMDVFLSPGQILFGRGSVDDVVVSINATSQTP